MILQTEINYTITDQMMRTISLLGQISLLSQKDVLLEHGKIY